MQQTPLSATLKENLQYLTGIFGSSTDFYTKEMTMAGVPCAVVLFTGISSPEKLWFMLLQAGQNLEAVSNGTHLMETLMKHTVAPVESTPIESREDLVQKLGNGFSVLLAEGSCRAVAISTQDMPQRSVSTPQGEGNLRSSQEGFTELLRNNIAMLRRQFRNENFVALLKTAKTRMGTEYAVCYDNTLAPPELIAGLQQHLAAADLPVLLDSAYFASFLKEDKWNLLPPCAYTERPATACARICEGKAVVLVNGCPYAMIVPGFFDENFECLDDYSSGAVFACLVRILKYIAFFLAILGPAFYIMAMNFTPEILPEQLRGALMAAEAQTPLSVMAEMLLITILLEIVREAGLRANKAISQTVSLVGAIIIGETAVSAGIISVPALTVAAAAMVATLAVPALYEQIILFRFAMIALAGLFGVAGLACGIALIFAMACGSRFLGYDYLYPLVPPRRGIWRDGLMRSIWTKLARKGYTVNEIKQS